MNFQEMLKQQLASQNFGDREPVDYPSSHLKNKELYFPKQNGNQAPTLFVRILPPAPGVGDGNFNVPAREIFLQTRNRSGKDLKLNAVLSPFPNQNDPLDVAITQWQAENRVPNNYNRQAKPSNRYYVNVVNMVVNPQTGQYEEERDPQTGQLVVRLLKLTYSACNGILEKLMEPMFAPQALQNEPMEVAQYSFISSACAFPIRLTKPMKGAGQMSYGVDVMTQYALGALPQGWESLLEDLQYQATPSVEYNADYVDYFIKVVNGEEPVQGQNQGQPTAPTMTNPQQGMYQAPAFTQQPVQPSQPVQQGYQTNMGATPTMPVPPVPPAPPVQEPVVVTDNVLPQDLTNVPDMAPTQVQEPVAETPTANPTTPLTTNGLPNIDALISNMQSGN